MDRDKANPKLPPPQTQEPFLEDHLFSQLAAGGTQTQDVDMDMLHNNL